MDQQNRTAIVTGAAQMMVGDKSRSLTMSAMSSTFWAHLCMHSWRSAISLS